MRRCSTPQRQSARPSKHNSNCQLWQCEQRYGPAFWPDFFREVRSHKKALEQAVNIKGDDNVRNERYRMTVECFDRLKGLGFKRMLERSGISTTVDAK